MTSKAAFRRCQVDGRDVYITLKSSSMENSLQFIPTKCTSVDTNSQNNFEAVTYVSYKKKVKEKSNSMDKNVQQNSNTIFDVKKARHEVLKFGISGFQHNKKLHAKVQLAVKLGAKPPRKAYKNYKQLLEEKKAQKLLDKQNLQFRQLGKSESGESLVKSKSLKYKRKGITGNLLKAYGTVKGKTKAQ